MAGFDLLVVAGVSSGPAAAQAPSLPQLGKAPLKEVLTALTPDEKVQLVVGMGFYPAGFPPGLLPPAMPGDDKVLEKVPGAAGRTHAVPRLGIPSLTLSDGPAGVRIAPIRGGDSTKTYYATAFPVATLLRQEWGFKGLVMTDWYGGKNALGQLQAGNDLLMPGTLSQADALRAALKSGALKPTQLDVNVTRVLELVLKSPAFKNPIFSGQPALKADAAVARAAAAEGMVLLRNEDGTLPLAAGRSTALFGNAAYQLIAGGTGSSDVNKAYTVSLAQGLAAAGYAVEAGTYTVKLAASSRNVRQSANFRLPNQQVVAQSRHLLSLQTPLTDLKPSKALTQKQ